MLLYKQETSSKGLFLAEQWQWHPIPAQTFHKERSASKTMLLSEAKG